MTTSLGAFRTTVILVLLLSWGVGSPVRAQSADGTLASIGIQDAPLGQALEQAAAAANISLVYDVSLVKGRRASCVAQQAAPDTLLHCLLDGHPIDYIQTSKGTYVLREAVRRPPQRGHLAGVVRDAEDGRPLVSAHVRLPKAKNVVGTVTDSTGRFRLNGLLPGPHTLVVNRLGYDRHQATVYVPPNGTARHEAALAPSPIVADSLVIDASRYGPASAQSRADNVSDGQLRWGDTGEAPNVLEAASSLLGVTTSPPYADLHIQGSSTGGHTLRLDGVPVRNPVSVGRLLGAFSPLALEGLTARKAGFGALYGNALSGTLELRHDLADHGTQYGTLRIDPRSIDARLEGTTTFGDTPVTAMLSARMSVWDVYQDAALTDLIDRWSTVDPVLAAAQVPTDTTFAGGSLGGRAQPNAGFYDLHGAARFKLSPADRLYVSAYYGGSRLGADLVLGRQALETVGSRGDSEPPSQISSSFTLPTHDRYTWTNTAAQVQYETPVANRTMATLRAAVSHYQSLTQSEVGGRQSSLDGGGSPTMVAIRQAAHGQEGLNEVTEVDLEGRFDVSLSGGGSAVWSVGLAYLGSRFRIGNAFAPRLQHETGTVRLRTAAETTLQLGTHTQIEGGLRLTGLPTQEAVYAEPRGALRYQRRIEGVGQIGLNVRGGLYRQFTAQFDLNRDGATAVVPTTRIWLPVGSALVPPRAYHLAADLTWQPAPAWSVELEGYRKWQPHLLAVDYPALRTLPPTPGGLTDPTHILDSSHGFAYGGGLRVAYQGEAVTSSLHYAFTRARRTFPGRFDGRLTPVPWANPHRLTLNAEVSLGGGLAIEAQGEGVWGRRWGYRRAYYAYLTPADLGKAWDRLRLDRPGSHVLPPRYRLDAGISITRSWGGVEVKGRLGVANVLDRRNVADWALQPHEDGTVSRWARPLPGRRAIVSIRIRY
ncbi:MAG: carboxypeptidase regulatory-like domain-containing protein [Salinibacter sp.]